MCGVCMHLCGGRLQVWCVCMCGVECGRCVVFCVYAKCGMCGWRMVWCVHATRAQGRGEKPLS